MLPDITPELTDEQIEQLDQARKLIPKLRLQIRRAKTAGIDMTEQEADLLAMEQQLEKLHRVYARQATSPK